MKLPRRKFLHLAAGAAALPAVSRFTWAQTYPTRPVASPVVGRQVWQAIARRLWAGGLSQRETSWIRTRPAGSR
jgi:hypothetical protein